MSRFVRNPEDRFCCDAAHMMKKHTVEKRYECNTFGKAFAHVTLLRQHQIIHTEVKLYDYDFFRKAFVQASSLECNIRLYTGDRPYECETCCMF